MSALSTSSIAAIEPSLLLTTSSTGEDVIALSNYLYERKECHMQLWSSSRNAWFERVLSDICTQLPFPSLRFLTGTEGDFQIQSDKYGEFSVSVLDACRIPLVMQDAKALLAYAENSPDVLARDIEPIRFDGWSAEAIRKEILESTPSPNPSHQNDGDTLWFLGSYIKMLIEILTAASNKGLVVIHLSSMAE